MQGIVWAVIQDADVLASIAPRYEIVQCHHITLLYGVDLEAWSYLVGETFEAIVTEECWNDRIQALRVTLPDAIPCENDHPHITVSHREGVEPKESNLMLAIAHFAIPRQLAIPVQIQFHAKSPCSPPSEP